MKTFLDNEHVQFIIAAAVVMIAAAIVAWLVSRNMPETTL